MTKEPRNAQWTRTSVFEVTSLVAMVCVVLLFFTAPGRFERAQARLDDRPLWLVVLLAAGAPVFLLGLGFFRRGPKTGTVSRGFAIAFAGCSVPGASATMVHHLVEPDPSWLGVLRGVGVALLLLMLCAYLVSFSRGYVELDRVLFTEASSIAFFATLLAAGSYAALENYGDLPRLSFAWIPVIGLGIWGICTLILKRRLS